MTAEEQARARWEADYHARQQVQQQQQHYLPNDERAPEELDTHHLAYELDDGRPRPAELQSRSTPSFVRR